MPSRVEDLLLVGKTDEQRGRTEHFLGEMGLSLQRRYISLVGGSAGEKAMLRRRLFSFRLERNPTEPFSVLHFSLIGGSNAAGQQGEFRRMRDLLSKF